MPTSPIDGRALAFWEREDRGAGRTPATSWDRPLLAVILVRDDAASHIYVRTKTTACATLDTELSMILMPAA
jgi:5,10-methylene-tetrahydrofolate dehydrogenase/methenyl tetrahydrofolate cyclohydrolase